MNYLQEGLKKIINALTAEDIDYMIVGGFAVNFYNRARFTVDIDFVLQIYPHHVLRILQHFPDWIPFLESFEESASKGQVFNITDFETGVRYDFMTYQDTDYNWTAFERRRKVDFLGIECMIASAEDLIISKLIWYGMSKSEKQLADITFLLEEVDLNYQYLRLWTQRQNILTYGLF